MTEKRPGFISPPALNRELKEEEDSSVRINKVSKALTAILLDIDNQEAASKINNITQTLVDQGEICDRLNLMYKEIFWIQKRLSALLMQDGYKPEAKESFQKRTSDIINEQVFALQRELFFKIVNAKEVAEGEKSEDGPALLYPGIEQIKNEILRNINTQTKQLRPAAVEICKSFRGIADDYVDTENINPNTKSKYDTISQSYELEKKIRTEISGDISLAKIEELSYLDEIIKTFDKLTKTYNLKIKSLKDKNPEKVINFAQKVLVLERGVEKSIRRVRPLQVLKNLFQKFPALERQLDLFAESYYQAKAVMKFLDEVNEEMAHVFQKHNIESFTVISFLRYKLNGTSHMYESIHYYYAMVQIEADIQETLTKRYENSQNEASQDIIKDELKKIGISDFVLRIHNLIAKMNESNYKIHIAFLEYKSKSDLEELRGVLKEQTALINTLHTKVKAIYKKVQSIFFSFLSEDLGATEFTTQFSNNLRKNKRLEITQTVRRGFEGLFATKKKEVKVFEKAFLPRFGGRLSQEKIAAMAKLKVRQDFQKEILLSIQKHPPVQELYIHILKDFINIKEDEKKKQNNDNTIVDLTKKKFMTQLAQFQHEDLPIAKKLIKKDELSERDIIVLFIASNITFQEIESFSRLLPGLPRNEFQLDSPYGRILLDIKTMFNRTLQYKSASGNFIMEKSFEKQERQKLISNICKFMMACLESAFKKIDNEESKIDSLMNLERRKYQKDLNNSIRYWHYLIQEQIEPGQGKRGKFRKYSLDEKKLMMKYISPKQLESIERQLEGSHDLSSDSKLFEVETFIMEIAGGLIEKFDEDLKIRAEFEEYEKNKKIKGGKLKSDEKENVLESDQFVPNVKKCIKKVNKVKRGDTINQFMNYWEYHIDQHVPSSDKRKKATAPKIELNPQKIDAIEYITGKQLEQILINLELIEKVRDNKKKKQLVFLGVPLLKIGQSCIKNYTSNVENPEMKNIERDRIEEISNISNNVDFKKYVTNAISLVSGKKAKAES